MAAAKREESITALIVDVAKSETSALPDGGDMLELFAAAEEEEEDLEELKKSCWKRLREAVPQIPWAKEKRHRLGKWVESVPVQLALVLLLVFDVLVVGAELALEEFAAHEMVCVIANSSGSAASSSSFAAEATAVAVLVPPEHWVVALEEAMHYIGLTVLLVFMLELLLLIIAYDSHFFTHVMFVLDLLVVLLVIRISHALLMAMDADRKKTHHELRVKLRHLRSYTMLLRKTLEEHGVDPHLYALRAATPPEHPTK